MTETTPPSPEPAPVAPPSPSARGPATRSGWAPWKRRALRWTTGLSLVFALGLVALWLVQVRPLREQAAALEQERQVLHARVEELETEVARLEAVEAENVALRAAKVELEQRSSVLTAKVGVAQAQFALAAGGEEAEVVEALTRADEHLGILEKALSGAQQESVRALRYRLAMASEETGSDPFAAQRDLEVLANGMETLEKELFGG